MHVLPVLAHLAFALSVLALSYGLTLLMRWRVRIIDTPNQRSSHQQPTPRSGGIAIVAACSVAVGAYLWLGDDSVLASGALGPFAFAYVIMVVMSVVDDVKQIGMRGKLAAQIGAAVLVVSAGFWLRVVDVPFVGRVDIGWFGGLLTVFWIVALTNAFNFMDGLDSLAGGQAVIAAGVLAVITFLTGSHFVFVISYVLLSACLGFLLHNLPPARIFMGDTGSQFLGFTFALLGVIASQFDMAETTIMIVPILLFSFLWDTAFTLVRRKIAGDPLTAHRTHLYQLLNRLGWSHRRVAVLYHGFAVLQGGLALLVYFQQGLSSLFVLGGLVVLFSLFSTLVIFKARRAVLL